ncbi:unnamed protein product [Oppiella nova]|uniref:Coiled-coil domain-containing protein 172 n=1 Tax=Oppiella nova TaxID=334625 RepID=A0A7R9L7R0_9ACAR|nr:unnamed protein product [Oppiella nova]CAG2158044.1 unnamed protein product [Oppiella nova]
METKALKDLFDDLIRVETQTNLKRTAVNALRTQSDTNERQLREVRDALQVMDKQLVTKWEASVHSDCEVAFIDNENAILGQQTQEFETKVRELRQKVVELRVNRKQKVNELVNECLAFGHQFGSTGSVAQQWTECEKLMKGLIESKDGLQTQLNSLTKRSQELDSLLETRNALNHETCRLKDNINRFRDQNCEMICNENKLKNELKELSEKESFGHEFVSLRKELQSIAMKPKTVTTPLETRFQSVSQLNTPFKPNIPQKPLVTTSETTINANECVGSDRKRGSDELVVKEVKKVWDLKRNRRMTALNQ